MNTQTTQVLALLRQNDDQICGSVVWAEKQLPCFRARRRKDNRRTLIAELPELGSLDRLQIAALSGSRPGAASPGNPNERSTQLQLRQLFPFECVLEPIQKELIHEQGLGLVKRA